MQTKRRHIRNLIWANELFQWEPCLFKIVLFKLCGCSPITLTIPSSWYLSRPEHNRSRNWIHHPTNHKQKEKIEIWKLGLLENCTIITLLPCSPKCLSESKNESVLCNKNHCYSATLPRINLIIHNMYK